MNDSNDLDMLLITRFEHEYTHVSAQPFVAATLREIRTSQRRAAGLRIGLRVAALLVVVAASPWLIAGVERLNLALEYSVNWTANEPVAWVVAAMGVATVLGVRILRAR